MSIIFKGLKILITICQNSKLGLSKDCCFFERRDFLVLNFLGRGFIIESRDWVKVVKWVRQWGSGPLFSKCRVTMFYCMPQMMRLLLQWWDFFFGKIKFKLLSVVIITWSNTYSERLLKYQKVLPLQTSL